MAIRYKILTVFIYTISIFAVGKYSSEKPATSIQTTEKQVEAKTEGKNVITKKVITETKKPDGSSVVVTEIDQTVNDQKRDDVVTQKESKESTSAVRPTISLSILGVNDFSQGRLSPTYGVAASKQVLGPFNIGAFGLMNGTVGVSVGVSF